MRTAKFASIVFSAMLLLSIVPSYAGAEKTANALTQDANLPKKTQRLALRAYEAGLAASQPEAVVASAIFQAVRFKMAYPELNYSKIVSALLRLSLHAETPVLRQNAQIAACVLSNYEAYLNAEEAAHIYAFTEETREQFFDFLNAKVKASFVN